MGSSEGLLGGGMARWKESGKTEYLPILMKIVEFDSRWLTLTPRSPFQYVLGGGALHFLTPPQFTVEI